MRFSRLSLLVVTLLLLSAGSLGAAESELARAEEIEFWEGEVAALRSGALHRALLDVEAKATRLQKVKSNSGFFPDATTRATLRTLDEEYQSSMKALARVKEQEEAMLAKIKPLYGMLSLQFAQEQKDQMAASITFVKDQAFNQALFESIFSLGDADSFGEVIAGFFGRWAAVFVLLYPFAIFYYAAWALPWSLYSYSSGIGSFFTALPVYAVSVFVFALPLLVLVVGLIVVARVQMKKQGLHRD